jgi:hypothetical protein
MAIRANDAYGYKSWLALGIQELGREVAAEVKPTLVVIRIALHPCRRVVCSCHASIIGWSYLWPWGE